MACRILLVDDNPLVLKTLRLMRESSRSAVCYALCLLVKAMGSKAKSGGHGKRIVVVAAPEKEDHQLEKDDTHASN